MADKLKMQTENLADKNYEMLSKMFPNALTETITGYDDDGKPIVERTIDADTYEQAYKIYNAEFDKQREKVEGLKRELENTSFFAFSKKKELKEKVAIELAELNKLKEPSDLKKAYYDMYK